MHFNNGSVSTEGVLYGTEHCQSWVKILHFISHKKKMFCLAAISSKDLLWLTESLFRPPLSPKCFQISYKAASFIFFFHKGGLNLKLTSQIVCMFSVQFPHKMYQCTNSSSQCAVILQKTPRRHRFYSCICMYWAQMTQMFSCLFCCW